MGSAEYNLDRCKAVILVGDRDFGRCPLASRYHRALWPVFGKPALQGLLEQLLHQGIKRAVIACASESDIILKNIQCPSGLSVTFQEKTLPRGPAGCIRDAAEPEDEHLLVLSGNSMLLPNIRELLQKHLESHADMTVFLNPPDTGPSDQPVDSQIYLCEPTALSCIPQSGYFDLKEGFVPAGIQAGLTIQAAALSEDPHHFRNWADYLAHLNNLLLRQHKTDALLEGFAPLDKESGVWIGRDVRISKKAQMYGPVVIGSHAVIADGTMIFGPAVIGENVHIAQDCLIEESVLLDNVTAGPGTRIKRSLIGADCLVQHRQLTSDLMPSPETGFRRLLDEYRIKQIRKQGEKTTSSQAVPIKPTLQQMIDTPSRKRIAAILGIAVFLALIVSYWKPTLRSLVNIWLESDEYSSGLLVPFIAIYVLWQRRTPLSKTFIKPCFAALGLLFLAQGMRFFGLYFMFASVERFSFVVMIGAVVLFVLGWGFFKKVLPVFLFLFLMLPLPNRVEGYLTVPLQAWATVSSVFCLETLGFSVIREGNVININGTLVAVAEACNGLRMLTAFIVVSGLVALTVHRSGPAKLVVLLSSIPIALACNTLRLIITAVAFTKLDTQRWEKVFHDFGGFAMMPVALLIILFELWLLSRLLIEPKNKQQQVVYRKGNERSNG